MTFKCHQADLQSKYVLPGNSGVTSPPSSIKEISALSPASNLKLSVSRSMIRVKSAINLGQAKG